MIPINLETLNGLDLATADAPVREAFLLKALQFLEATPRVPLAIFMAKLKVAPVNSIEVVTFYVPRKGEHEIHLVQRPANDPDFANQWHSAGKTLLNRQPIAIPFSGISLPDETGIDFTHVPIYAGGINMPNKPRAHYWCSVFIRMLDKKPTELKIGRFVPLNELGNYHLVRSHKDAIIPMAINRLLLGAPYFVEDLSETDA